MDDGEYFCRVILASDATRFVSDSSVKMNVENLQELASGTSSNGLAGSAAPGDGRRRQSRAL